MDLVARLNYAWSKKYRTRTAFADAAGISKQYLSGILNGNKGDPSPETEEGLARALGMSRAKLIDHDDQVFLSALEHDPTAPDPEPAEGVASSERRSGLLREYEIPNTVTDGGVVEGIVAGKGATNRVAALIEGIKHRKGDRSGDHEPIKRSLVGVPKDIDLVFVAARLEVRAADQIVRTIDKGKVLLVDTSAKPRAAPSDEAELVIAERTDPTPGDPTDDEPDPIPGRSRLMRYVVNGSGRRAVFESCVFSSCCDVVRSTGTFRVDRRTPWAYIPSRHHRGAPRWTSTSSPATPATRTTSWAWAPARLLPPRRTPRSAA